MAEDDALTATDREAGLAAVAPRVSLADLEASIAARIDVSGYDIATDYASRLLNWDHKISKALGKFSLCLLVLKNGYVVVGKSAPASDANFNKDLGKKLAYEDAVRQLWPLMGYALRERLSENDNEQPRPAAG